ncbi:MAG: RiPP maturation radical SAM C-methyltransferase [Planctomycetota bacterium]
MSISVASSLLVAPSIAQQEIPIVLVVPPFASVACPALGPALLAAACRKQNMSATVLYLNLEFASRIGFTLYQKINHSYSEDLLGETVFQAFAFDTPPCSPEKLIEELFENQESARCRESQILREEFTECLQAVDRFLNDSVQKILAMNPKIVGFSSVFQQTLASIAIARRLKQENPQIITVFGGANASQPMGKAISSVTPVFDFVFSGESDFDFPRFCQQYLQQKELPSQSLIECQSVYDMDQTALPEYDDYFEQLRPYQLQQKLPKELPLWLHIESSRGCWWGAKSHCTFCGLNALEMTYRRKSKDRILQDIDFVARYGIKQLHAVDNIMPFEFHKDVLPALIERKNSMNLFYEVKSNLKERDLQLLASAGVTMIQPGIESLSSNVLKQMAKGVTGTQNICLLRNGITYHIGIIWNLMVGLPGERKEDYESIIRLFPWIEHLQPPDGWGPVRLDRYSPYHSHPEKYGIRDVKPFRGYQRLFPAQAELDQIAYYFVGKYTTEFLQDADLQEKIASGVNYWKSVWEKGKERPKLCAYSLGAESLLIEDTRRCAKNRYYLANRPQAQFLRLTEQPFPCDKLNPEQQNILKELIDRHFIIEHENHYISIVTQATIPKSVSRLAIILFLLTAIGILAIFYMNS